MANDSDSARRLALGLLAGALLLGSLPRADAVARLYASDADQRTDVRRYYMGMASSALEGRGFIPTYPTNFIPPPGQALFLYGLKLLWPESDYQHLRSVQAVISLATILLAYVVGSQLHDVWSGVLCAWLVALNYRLSQMVGTLLAETNHVFLLLAFLAVLLSALRRPSPRWFLAAGLLLGIACLFKPLPTLLAPALLVPLASGQARRAAIGRGVALLAGFGLAVTPWTARNLVHYGRLYPISTNGGTLLALSNSPGLDSSRPDMTYWDDLYRLPYFRDPAIEARFSGVVDADGKPEENLKDRAYFRKTIAYAVRHPLHFGRNYFYKLRNFVWHPTDQLAHGGPFPFRELPGQTRAVVLAGLLGLAWLLLGQPRSPGILTVATVVLYLWGMGALFHLTRDGRMTLPFEALVCVPAAVAATRWIQWGRGRVRARP